MAFLKKTLPILLLPILAGCEEVFTPDMPSTPVLCINSLITVGEPIKVAVSKTRLYTDTKDKSNVNDAIVEIYANGQLQDENYLPNENDVIQIVAQSHSVGSACAEVVVPKSVPIHEVKWEAYDANCYPYDNYKYYIISFNLRIRLTIVDPIEENYYRFTFRNPHFDGPFDDTILDGSHRPYYLALGDLQYEMEPIFGEHISIFESIMGSDAYGFTFFTDRQFAGDSYTLTLLFDNCTFLGSLSEMPNCQCDFILNTISPSYYNWANYVWQRDNGTLSELSDCGFGDPICGYSNCSSGAGVVAALSKSIYSIDLADFIKETITKCKQ